MTTQETKKLLEEQLQLLSELSKNIFDKGAPFNYHVLCEMSREMCEITKALATIAQADAIATVASQY